MRDLMLNAALDYRHRGWSVIPMLMAKKKPAIRWKPFQSFGPAETTISRWFGSESSYGIAVIFGEVSGGLVSRDFDEMAAYESWRNNHPELAASLPTVATTRGRHVYCRGRKDHVHEIRSKLGKPDGVGAITFTDGELRAGVGCYSVVPPSQHPSGATYRWVNPPDEFPFVNLEESGLIVIANDTEEDRGQQRTTEDMERGRKGGNKIPWNSEIEAAILETLPTKKGTRNKAVFSLARTLKAIPSLTDAPVNVLRPYVEYWHQKALPVIGTKEFEESWIDFLQGWPKVKFSKGCEPMALALERTRTTKLPEEAGRYGPEQLRLLVSLCRELQRASGEFPFFLSCRKAESLLGVCFKTANRWLFLLVKEKVLELVSRGNMSTRKASRYRYTGSW
jgi:hypothetical protein